MTSHSLGQPAIAPSAGGLAFPQPAIDLVHLSRQTMDDKELGSELLRLFARQAHTVVGALPDAGRGAAHGMPAADLLHLLCGSARAVGAWAVAEEAQRMEGLLRRGPESGPIAPTHESLDRLGRTVDHACKTIDELLGERD